MHKKNRAAVAAAAGDGVCVCVSMEEEVCTAHGVYRTLLRAPFTSSSPPRDAQQARLESNAVVVEDTRPAEQRSIIRKLEQTTFLSNRHCLVS